MLVALLCFGSITSRIKFLHDFIKNICIYSILVSCALWGLNWEERGKISCAFIVSHSTEAVHALIKVMANTGEFVNIFFSFGPTYYIFTSLISVHRTIKLESRVF